MISLEQFFQSHMEFCGCFPVNILLEKLCCELDKHGFFCESSCCWRIDSFEFSSIDLKKGMCYPLQIVVSPEDEHIPSQIWSNYLNDFMEAYIVCLFAIKITALQKDTSYNYRHALLILAQAVIDCAGGHYIYLTCPLKLVNPFTPTLILCVYLFRQTG